MFVRKQLGLFLGSLLSPLVCVTVPHQCHRVLTTVTTALIFLFTNCLAVLGLFSSHVSGRTSFLCHRRPCWRLVGAVLSLQTRMGRSASRTASPPDRGRVASHNSELWLPSSGFCSLQHTEAVHLLLDSHLSISFLFHFNVHRFISNIKKYSWFLCVLNPVTLLGYSRMFLFLDSLGYFSVDKWYHLKIGTMISSFPICAFFFLADFALAGLPAPCWWHERGRPALSWAREQRTAFLR